MKRLVFCLVFCLVAIGLLSANSVRAQMYDNFTTLEGAPDGAKASLFMMQRNGKTKVLIVVQNSSPNTLYTVWVRLSAGSPLTAKTVAPLANPEDIEDLAAVTPAGNLTPLANALGLFGEDPKIGSANLANGFHTNGRGHGFFYTQLDYPVIKGAFQFGEFDGSLSPIALGKMPAFTIRLAAHPDGTGHGLVPDVHVPSFDWAWK